MSTPISPPALAGAADSSTGPELAKENSSRGGKQECALLYADGNNLRIIGGQKIGFSNRHRIQFCWTHPPNKRPFVGIKLWFPRATNGNIAFFDEAGQPSSVLTVTVKLHAGTWTSSAEVLPDAMLATLPAPESSKAHNMLVLRFTLNKCQKPSVDSFGLPFVARDAEDDRIVNHGEVIEGVKSLRDICVQTEFLVLFRGNMMLPRGKDQFIKDFPKPVKTVVFPYSIGYVFVLSCPITCI